MTTTLGTKSGVEVAPDQKVRERAGITLALKSIVAIVVTLSIMGAGFAFAPCLPDLASTRDAALRLSAGGAFFCIVSVGLILLMARHSCRMAAGLGSLMLFALSALAAMV